MKRLLILLVLLSTPLLADEADVLKELIVITKKNLEDEERLLAALTQFQKLREGFIADPENAKLATALVRASYVLEAEISKGNLAHLLSKELLEEVHFFSKLGKG